MATVHDDQVESSPQPITTPDGPILDALTQASALDALDSLTKENHQPEFTDTQIPADDNATSPQEVTKLPPHQLDIIADALFEAKKLADSTEPAMVVDGDDDSSKAIQQEDAAMAHEKDSTADTNISDATTVVAAEHENEDTLKEDGNRNDTQHDGAGGNNSITTEETPLIGSVASHDLVTEVTNPDAGEEAPSSTVTAEVLTLENEAAAGSVTAKDDPIITTAVGETPITESESIEPVQSQADKASDLADTTQVADSARVEDKQTNPGNDDEADSAHNTDHKTELEETLIEAEDQIAVTAAQEAQDERQQEITVQALSEGGEQAAAVEIEEPASTVQVEEVGEEAVATEAPASSSTFSTAEETSIEIVAPTPALVDDRDLEASDVEGAAVQSESSSVPPPGITAEDELGSTGTVTPQPEPEVGVLSSTGGEEAGEGGIVDADVPAEEEPAAVAEEDVPTPVAVEAVTPTGEVVDAPHEVEDALEVEESPEVAPAAEEGPAADAHEVEAAPVVEQTPETAAEEAHTDELSTSASDEQLVEPPVVEAEAAPASETLAAEEVPIVEETPEVEAPSATVEEAHVAAEEAVPTEEGPAEVEEQKGVAVEDTHNTEDTNEPSVEDVKASEEPVSESAVEAQEQPVEPTITEADAQDIPVMEETEVALVAVEAEAEVTPSAAEEVPVADELVIAPETEASVVEEAGGAPVFAEADVEAVSVPEISAVEEVPIAPEVEASAVEEEAPVPVEETIPAEEAVEMKEVEEQTEAVVEDTHNAEDTKEPTVEDVRATEEPIAAEVVSEAQEAEVTEPVEPEEVEEQREVAVEDTPSVEGTNESSVEDVRVTEEFAAEVAIEAQEVEEQVTKEEVTESPEQQQTATESSVSEVLTVQEESKPAVLDEAAPAVEETLAMVEPVVDDAVIEEAKVVAEEPTEAVATEPIAAEEVVEDVVEKQVKEEPVVEERIVEPAVLDEPAPEASAAELPEPTSAAEAPVEEEVPVEETIIPEHVPEISALLETGTAGEEPAAEERATDTPIPEVSPAIEEKLAEEPVSEAVGENGAAEETTPTEAAIEPVVEESASAPQAETPAPLKEPTNAPTEPLLEEEESATELPTYSDEPAAQEEHEPEEKPPVVPVLGGTLEEPVAVAEHEMAIPEVFSRDFAVFDHAEEREAEVAESVEEQAAPAIAESSENTSPGDSLAIESELPGGHAATEAVIVPEVVTEKQEDDNELFFKEVSVQDTPTDQNEAAEGTTAPEQPVLDIPENAPQIERPWTPSFQVTTIGQGVSLPVGEEAPTLTQDNDVQEVEKILPAQPAIIVEPTETSAEEIQAPAEQTGEPETESASLSRTPSYSVHSQGSPSPTHASLEPETHPTDDTQNEIPPTNDANLTIPEEIISAVEKDDQPTTDTKITEPQPVTEDEPGADHSEITEDSELLREQPVETVSTLEEPVAHLGASTQEEERNEELVLLDTSASEEPPVEISSSLTPPAEQDRPASPSWVPSYSVSRQGSPLPQQTSLPAVDTFTPEPELTSEPSHAAVLSDGGVQEEVLLTLPTLLPTLTVNDMQPEGAKDLQVEEDRPSTPWTPSYSVTHQGVDVLKETRIESLTPPDQPKEPEAPIRRSLSEEMEGSSAFSPTALIGAGVAGGAAVLAASAAFGGSKDSNSKRSENTSEGSVRASLGDDASFYFDKELKRWVNKKVTSPTASTLEALKNEPVNGKAVHSPQPSQDKVFPTVEIPGDTTKLSSILPPLDENIALDTTTPLSPESSPTLSRKRLESTTSSRLFPGGWFSNTSQIPNERTSLEVAEGVFASPKQGATIEEMLPSPAVDPITPVRELSSSDKRKWCIIM